MYATRRDLEDAIERFERLMLEERGARVSAVNGVAVGVADSVTAVQKLEQKLDAQVASLDARIGAGKTAADSAVRQASASIDRIAAASEAALRDVTNKVKAEIAFACEPEGEIAKHVKAAIYWGDVPQSVEKLRNDLRSMERNMFAAIDRVDKARIALAERVFALEHAKGYAAAWRDWSARARRAAEAAAAALGDNRPINYSASEDDE